QELAFIANKTRELSVGSVTRTALLQVASAAQRGLDESRRAIQTLTTNDDEPFEVALVQTVEEVADRLGTNVEIEAEPAPEITSDQREQLLRIGSDLGCGLGLDLDRSEEHTSELQSRENLVCRLLLEKKKKNKYMVE